jgi:hypothetical protein
MKRVIAVVIAATLAPCALAASPQGGGRTAPPPQGGGRDTSAPARPSKPRKPARRSTGSRTSGNGSSPSVKAPTAAELLVRTSPGGCIVLLDGNVAGTTNSDGALVVGPVSAGKHVVTVRKDRYVEERHDVTFVSGNDRSLEVTLKLLPSKLTVNANIPDAEIRIGDGESQTGRVDSLELAPGRYEVTVAKLGYKTYSGTVDLEAGRSVRIDASLAPLALKGLVAEAEDEFVRERYDRVIALCDMVLADKPNRPRANLLLGASYLRAGRPAESVEPLLRALEGGERIAVPVRQHRPSLGAGETVGLLVLGRDVVAWT